jgi:anti-sigma factor RsiW
MGCEYFEERLSSHLDGKLVAQEREDVLAHLEVCNTCSAHWKYMRDMRSRLLRLEEPRFPAVLAVQLRVLASHEHVRKLARANFRARLRNWRECIRLNFENLMRPVALPVAGGLVSALILFSALVPSLSFPHQASDDQPLSFVDPHGYLVNRSDGEVPVLESTDAVVSSDDNVLELTIDKQGNVFDYTVLQGQFTPDMASIILWSTFAPAMSFGRPTFGKTLVVLPGRRPRARS